VKSAGGILTGLIAVIIKPTAAAHIETVAESTEFVMKNLWNEEEARAFKDDPKAMRVYTSRLLGQNPDLVLHGGGNTSVKLTEKDFFGQDVDLLFVKGSGWDLATIEVEGFTPLRIQTLLKLAEFEHLSDTDMVTQQRVVMLDPNAPNASVEAILHAVIPHRYVDHTHADAIIAITNTENGEERIRAVFGDRIMIVPYVMPGFVLARKIYEMTRDVNWDNIDGIVLMNHGLFTFNDDARKSYEATIDLVTRAEQYLETQGANRFASREVQILEEDLLQLAQLRKTIAQTRGHAVILRWDYRPEIAGYSNLPDIPEIGTRGPVTPDHSIRAKRVPMIWDGPAEDVVKQYVADYRSYFEENKQAGMTCLEPAPRWIIWPGKGIVSVGASCREAKIIGDIAEHTARVVQQAEALGGWKALSPKEVFDVEYWELEQAKLKKKKETPALQCKIALVTGAASGIGLACTRELHANGAAVVAVDLNPQITELFNSHDCVGRICDITDERALKDSIHNCVSQFGGLDIVVSNAGVFSKTSPIADLQQSDWESSLDLNLTQHKNLMKHSHQFLKNGIDPTIIIVGSRNVTAPGPGAASYSVAKAGLNQLMRIAALEWGGDGIRVNILHPDCVYDTGLWSGGVLENRASTYGMTTDAYMSRNILQAPVTSDEVGRIVVTLAGKTFLKTTGAQFPIDGGNERVI
jgi:rhamnose utilization protein RhaD (predicted bifunctional aldolase and dehydrogenase)/NAD(P)-dependent dehydrogenase (short-subunit alcohol dehydrogenase family)